MILPAYPFRVEVEVTNICNLDCMYCYVPHGKPKNLEKIEYVLAKTKAEADPFELVILGGEPFKRNDLLDILEFARAQSFTSIGMSTNGTLLSTQSEKQIGRLKELVDSGLGLQVSLDSTNPEINNLTRDLGGATLDGIRLLEKNAIGFSIGIVITNLNYKSIKETVADLLHYETLRSINLEVLEPSPNISIKDYVSLNINHNEKERLYGEVTTMVAERSGGKVPVLGIKPTATCADGVEPLLNGYGFKACTAGLLKAAILSNGDVVPCVNLRSVRIGNIYQKSWKKIWSDASERFLSLQRGGPQCLFKELRREEKSRQEVKRSPAYN